MIKSRMDFVIEDLLPSIAVVVAIVLFVVVCYAFYDDGNNFPPYKQKELEEKTIEVNKALNKSGINDHFAFEREMHLVSYILERRIETRIKLLFFDRENNATKTVSYNCTPEYMNDCEYRELFKADLTLSVIDNLHGIDCDLVAVIVSWTRIKEFPWSKEGYYSVCDFDCDGKWDYLLEGLYEHDSMAFVDKVPEDTGIYREIDGIIVGLSAGCYKNSVKMVELKDLPKDKTFKHIEKLLE